MSDETPLQLFFDRTGAPITDVQYVVYSRDRNYRFVRETRVLGEMNNLIGYVSTIWVGMHLNSLVEPTICETTAFARLNQPNTEIGLNLTGDGAYWVPYPSMEPLSYATEAEALLDHPVVVQTLQARLTGVFRPNIRYERDEV